MDANEDENIDPIDYGFCEYIGEDDMDLLQHYCVHYDTDDLDEMVSWLNKLGYNKKQIHNIFNMEELFDVFYNNFQHIRE